MKNQFLVFVFIYFIAALTAHQAYPQTNSPKGATPINANEKPLEIKNTYAVVVGISDYQDPRIPDLRFADKDAEAFANYLRSSAGGKLDGDHMKVLINQQATMAQFANTLDWLWEVCKEGDEAIIYFSGHGDVEKKSLTQPGFLLCWDAPARVYMAGGAFALPMLQEVISTLSIQNKAKVIVITDACRSGTLAGSSVGGAQATAANLSKQFGNEIKIMSCQPNEYSIEGEQWGGGRGAFSYHLLDALYGMADNNKDQFVTLQEVGRYLEDHVSNEVAPVSQVPMTVGNRNERLTNVNQQVLASIKSGKVNQTMMLSAIESRGIEEDVLAKVDTNTRRIYALFKSTLKEKVFLEPANACAEAYYQQLIQEPKLERLHSTMKRNYATALQDDAQQVLNTLLKTGLTKEVLRKSRSRSIYRNYPIYLQRAAALLGEQHYMFKTLMARKFFFEGKIQPTPELRQSFYHQALSWQPDLPHVLCDMITVFNRSQEDSAVYYAAKASALIPTWVLPYILLSEFYEFRMGNPEKVEKVLDDAIKVDSNSVYLWYVIAGFYANYGRYAESEKWFLKTIDATANDVCFPCAHNELGVLYTDMNRLKDAEEQFKKALQLDSNFGHAYSGMGFVYMRTQRPEEAEKYYMKALELDPEDGPTHYNLGDLYLITGRFDLSEKHLKQALLNNRQNPFIYEVLGRLYTETKKYSESEQMFRNAIELDANYGKAYSGLGIVFLSTNKLDEAEKAFKKGIVADPKDIDLRYNLACVFNLENKTDQAFEALEKAFQMGFNDYDWIQEDEDLSNLRKQTQRWNAMMKKYFPEKVK